LLRIYPTYHLLRLNWRRVILPFLLVFILSPNQVVGKTINNIKSYADSVFSSLNKYERISKLMVLPISDMSNTAELNVVEEIIKNHGSGGIIIRNGTQEEVKTWVRQFRHKHFPNRPFVALEWKYLLEMPLEGMGDFPPLNQLELLSNDSLLMDLGYWMGSKIKNTGIDLVILDSELKYLDLFKANYLAGVESAGVTIAFRSVEDEGKLVNLTFANSKESISILVTHDLDLTQAVQIFDNIDLGADMFLFSVDPKKLFSFSNSWSKLKQPKKKILKSRYANTLKFTTELDSLNRRLIYKREVDQENLLLKSLVGSVVLVRNQEKIFPIKNLEQYNFASIAGNQSGDKIFRDYLNKYSQIAHYDFNYFLKNSTNANQIFSHFDQVIVKLSPYEINNHPELIEKLKSLNQPSKIIIVYSGEKVVLDEFSDLPTILFSPESTHEYAQLIPQNIFGSREITGRILSETKQASDEIRRDCIPSIGRLAYNIRNEVDINQERLFEIDIIVRDAIQLKSFPGCQVFMAKNGKVIYNKSFGYLTYDSLMAVEHQTVYDIASITKVAATVPSIMFLNDWHKLSIFDSIGHYISDYNNTDKSGIKIEDLLIHQSGLRSYYPFWRNAEFDQQADDFRFKLPAKRRFKYKSTSINWGDSIRSWIISSKFNSLKNEQGGYGYLYSDLGFMSLKELSETRLNQPLDIFLHQNLYEPMGMISTGFNPLCQWPIDIIAPTEEDIHLRNSLVWGKVHDRNAALLDGVSGHAGLFSNASDLGKYMQMHLQGGYYGGRNYFSSETINKFIEKHQGSDRRALGWDRPDLTVENASKYASDNSFGHSGFTGTIIWADPDYDLVYVFLSNRVYPDAQNNKLIQNNIRTRIHDIMYESFLPNKN
jgi:CubicO group peptidase (beta-lactamase class C family)